jgi:hypothetical protein
VAPFEPEREAPPEAPSTASPNDHAGAGARDAGEGGQRAGVHNKIRTRYHRVRIGLYQLLHLPSQSLEGPSSPASVHHSWGVR